MITQFILMLPVLEQLFEEVTWIRMYSNDPILGKDLLICGISPEGEHLRLTLHCEKEENP